MPSTSRFRAKLDRIPSTRPSLFSILVFLVVVVGGVATHGTLLPPLVIIGAILAAVRQKRRQRPVATDVRAGRSGIRVGEELVPRSTIRSGAVIPGAAPRVILRRGWRDPLQFYVESVGQGRDLLRAVGLDTSQTVASFRTLPRNALKPAHVALVVLANFVALIVASQMHVDRKLIFAGMMVTMVATLLATAISGRIEVGADGVVWRWRGEHRFIPYDDIVRVAPYDFGQPRSSTNGIAFVLRGGEVLRVPLPWGTRGGSGERTLIQERIREAMESYRRGGAEADAALLRRGDRAVGAWIAALRSLGAGANVDMRTAPLPRERLFRIVEDAAISAPDRAAAAVALGGTLDQDERARLRDVAASTAAAPLRIAIEAAASSAEDAEIEAALEAVDQAPARLRM